MHRTEAKLAKLSETARRIYFAIKQKPGIQFSEAGRAVGLSSHSNVRYHLDKLRRAGLVMELSEGEFKHFFVVGDHDRKLHPIIGRFSRKRTRRIAELLLEGPMSQGEIAQRLNCLTSALGFHLGKMVASKDLQRRYEGRLAIYSLADPELVRAALFAQGHAVSVELQSRSDELQPKPQAAD